MAKDPEAVKIKVMRRFILTNLNRVYPTPLRVGALYNVVIAFDEHYDLELLKKDLTYLKQKEYVRFVDEAIGGAGRFDDKYISLTAEGKEIADRTQTDPALEI
jgi:hypothetical protein